MVTDPVTAQRPPAPPLPITSQRVGAALERCARATFELDRARYQLHEMTRDCDPPMHATGVSVEIHAMIESVQDALGAHAKNILMDMAKLSAVVALAPGRIR